MKRIVSCCGVLVLIIAAFSLPAIARQTQNPPSAEYGQYGPPAPATTTESRPPEAVVTPPLAKFPNIDDLLNKLDSLKAQKAALEKAEKETVELLKEKLRVQKLRLQKLGVHVQEGNAAPPPPATSSPPPAPTSAN